VIFYFQTNLKGGRIMRYQTWNDATEQHSANFLTLGRILRVTFGMAIGVITGLVWAITLPL
jgi:hypothetical protein